MTNLDHALAYAARGWRVHPLRPNAAPLLDAWQDKASTDPDTIRTWWAEHPDAGIGIATGPRSGIWVLDVDTDRRRNKTGDESLAELLDAYGPLPDTYEVITGSGGRHLYFTYPTDGRQIRNNQSGRLGTDLDVRGDGGYVVAPPTAHRLYGTPFEVEASSAEHPVAAPGWLVAMVELDDTPVAPRQPAADAGDRPGDAWEAATSWDELLVRDGWTKLRPGPGGEDRWTRPGKDAREGPSATVGYGGSDVLKVFTSSVGHLGLLAEGTYTRFGYLAATRFGGDHAAAARWCRQQGHGATTADPHDLGLTALGAHAGTSAPGEAQGDDPWHLEVPIDIGADRRPPAPPIDAFPDWIAAQIRNVTNQLACDPMLPTTFALGALSVASLGHVRINVRNGETLRTTGLYLAAAGPAASGKSPALDMMMGPVRAHEQRAIAHAAQEVARAEARRAVAEKAAKEAIDNAARLKEAEDGAERAVKAEQLKMEAQAIEIPQRGELMTGDITPERLATIMAENAERIAIVSDESGVLDVDRYGDKTAGKKMDIHLQGYTGQPVVVHRQNAPTVRLNHPLLAIVVGVQPKALVAAMADREFRDRGLAARFLTAATDQLAANTDIDVDVWDAAVAERYEERLGALATRWASWATPATLDIAPDGRQAYSRWAGELRQREIGGDLEGEGGWVSKMRSAVLRIAALFHLADGGNHDEPIAEGTVERAIEVGEWFIAHHLHDVDRGAAIETDRLLRALVSLATEGGETGGRGEVVRATGRFVARRDLGRRGPRGLRTIDEYAPILEQLVEAGWVRLVGAGERGNLQFSALVRRAAAIEVHPEAWMRDSARRARQTEPGASGDDHEMQRDGEGVARVARVAYRGFRDPSPSVVEGPGGGRPRDQCDTRDGIGTSCHSIPWSAFAPPDPHDPSEEDL